MTCYHLKKHSHRGYVKISVVALDLGLLLTVSQTCERWGDRAYALVTYTVSVMSGGTTGWNWIDFLSLLHGCRCEWFFITWLYNNVNDSLSHDYITMWMILYHMII